MDTVSGGARSMTEQELGGGVWALMAHGDLQDEIADLATHLPHVRFLDRHESAAARERLSPESRQQLQEAGRDDWLGGYGGCNRIGGAWRLEADGTRLEVFVTRITDRECSGMRGRFEEALIEMLSATPAVAGVDGRPGTMLLEASGRSIAFVLLDDAGSAIERQDVSGGWMIAGVDVRFDEGSMLHLGDCGAVASWAVRGEGELVIDRLADDVDMLEECAPGARRVAPLLHGSKLYPVGGDLYGVNTGGQVFVLRPRG